MKKVKTQVNIRKAGSGYVIEVEDEHTENSLVITKIELEKIVLYGEKILYEKDKKK